MVLASVSELFRLGQTDSRFNRAISDTQERGGLTTSTNLIHTIVQVSYLRRTLVYGYTTDYFVRLNERLAELISLFLVVRSSSLLPHIAESQLTISFTIYYTHINSIASSHSIHTRYVQLRLSLD